MSLTLRLSILGGIFGESLDGLGAAFEGVEESAVGGDISIGSGKIGLECR